MRYIPLIVLTLCVGVSAQVTGDKSQKVYWSNDCAEIRLVPLRDTVNYPSAKDAEAGGLTKAKSCTDHTRAAMMGTSSAVKPPPARVREIIKGSAFLDEVRSNLPKFEGKRERIVGTLGLSDLYQGKYQGQDRTFHAFIFLDSVNGAGWFYMRKTKIAEDIISVILDPARKGSTLYDCQVFFEGISRAGALYGDLKSCKYWEL